MSPAARWVGVFPALTTPFNAAEELDLAALATQAAFQLGAGVDGLIVLGSLGENGTLDPEEKDAIVRTVAGVVAGRVPLLATVAERSTRAAVRAAKAAIAAGATGLMLLPPMQYASTPAETEAYLRAVAAAVDVPIMLYSNPLAYRTDLTPELLARLADEPKFVALKESSGDTRRLTDLKNRLGDRYALFCGVDDLAFEALTLGADGWVAGLVVAFPKETVAIYKLAKAGRYAEALAIYRWFMPLLHLDVGDRFVHQIKLAMQEAGVGSEQVRAPRRNLDGALREEVVATLRAALATRPALPTV